MTGNPLASRYARALAQALGTDEEFEQTADEIEALSKLLGTDTLVKAAFENPLIPRARRVALLEELSQTAGLSPKTTRLLRLLETHGRLGLVAEMAEAFARIRDERRGVIEAELTTAVPLEDSLSLEWERVLGSVTGLQVRLKKEVDPGIIGGAVARIGSIVYDGSLRSQMAALRQRLIGR